MSVMALVSSDTPVTKRARSPSRRVPMSTLRSSAMVMDRGAAEVISRVLPDQS